MVDNRAIGVIDSGVGGLTVVKELKEQLAGESIIYFGDNANVPYGNKREEEIAQLTKNMIDFLIDKDVKVIAVACNTISSLLDKYFTDYDIPIVSIIKPAADYVVENGIKEVGVIATKFTVQSGAYDRFIREGDESIRVISEGSPNLAQIIDSGNFTEVRGVIDLHMTNILSKGDLKHIILGCTHYPIVLDKFKERSPSINFINPAYEQVRYINQLLEARNMKAQLDKSTFQIYTTGKEETYHKMLNLLSIDLPDNIIELSCQTI